MKKIVLWTIVGILAATLVAAGFWWLTRPQVIVLSNGTKLTLLGVTYGKHNVPPKIKLAGRSIRSQARLETTNDVAVAWIEAQYKQRYWPNFQMLISDKANTAAVTTWAQSQTQVRNGISVMGFTLNAFPHRDSSMVLRIMSYGNNGLRLAKGRFIISNPVHDRDFPQWAPTPLPDTESDGDLDVTLTNFNSNSRSPYNQYPGITHDDPLNKAVQLGFDAEQNGHPATNWQPVQVATSDATGNQITGWINRDYNNGQMGLSYLYQPGLWPNEPAWKLRIEFSRSSGFNDDELWTVSNIPVKQGTQQDANEFWNYGRGGKQAFAKTTINGVQVQVFPVIEYASPFRNYPGMNGGNNSKVVGIAFKTDPDADSAGMRMTVAKVTDDQGHDLQQQGSSWGNGMFQYQFPVSRPVQSVNITIALHKSRFVEFMVQPTK